ncbi:hypothetical protein H5410_013115 [Solanum commersonii]|uniref:Uncharacterized protein n=1 Tax=Solanum commersonii TaxID=4109 RepID=A0A9J6AU82_SOLCO|nr:hypothetical protein H5410_013115 [Solanum commersonii]
MEVEVTTKKGGQRIIIYLLSNKYHHCGRGRICFTSITATMMDANPPYLIPLSFAFISITCHFSTYIQIRVPLGPHKDYSLQKSSPLLRVPFHVLSQYQFTQLAPISL